MKERSKDTDDRPVLSKEEAERRAMRSLAQEGIHLTPSELAHRQRVVHGELTEAEYRAEVTADIEVKQRTKGD